MKTITLLFLVISFAFGFACGDSASTQTTKNSGGEIKQVTVNDADKAVKGDNVQFIDVRMDSEYKSGHAPGAKNFPLDEIETSLASLDKNKSVYVICETGRRSQKASEILKKNGFTDVYNVQGGTSAWKEAGLPIEK